MIGQCERFMYLHNATTIQLFLSGGQSPPSLYRTRTLAMQSEHRLHHRLGTQVKQAGILTHMLAFSEGSINGESGFVRASAGWLDP